MRATWIAPLLAAAAGLGSCGGGDDGSRAAGSRPIIGIGEQGAAMFAEKRFADLGIEHVRLVVAYDALRKPGERALVDSWIAEARRTGSEPFVTFAASRGDPETLPSVAEFRRTVRTFRARYPDVRVFAPWNEINHASQPTRDAPQRAAEYYNVLRAECPKCTVLAGDLLDQAGMLRYLAAYRRALDGDPQIWGLHNYADTNRFRDSGLKDLLAAVPGEIWLTETGGIVKFGRSFPRDERRAARAIEHALKLARDHERVARVYLYNWTGAAPDARFDSGLIAPDGASRPGYEVLVKHTQ